MSWLIVAILSYLVLALVFLLDKYLLVQRISDPRLYVFYVGLLNILALVFIPFVGFDIPETKTIILSLLTGAVFVLALFWFFKALQKFEASRVVPAVGGALPIFTLILIYLLSGGKETLSLLEFPAFTLLIFGTVLITYERAKAISFQSFKFSLLAAFLFSLYFVLLKYVYLDLPFWSGLIWTRIGAFLMAVFLFFIFRDIRQGVLRKRFTPSLKGFNFAKTTPFLFILTRAGAGIAGLLQTWAIFLAPLSFVAMINALQGTQYLFLLLITFFLSLKFPYILKEEISKQTLAQKILAILLISAGIAVLAFSKSRL